MQHRQPDTHPLRLEDVPAHCQPEVALGVGPFGRGQKEAVWGLELAVASKVLEWALLCVLDEIEELGWAGIRQANCQCKHPYLWL